MGLETGDFLDDLVQTNPITATDPVSEGSDHLRLLKKVLQQTFPNFDEALTVTPAQLNDAALRSAANVFTGENSFSSNQPKLLFNELDVTTDTKNWLFRIQGGTFGLHTATDAAPSTIVDAAFQFARSGTGVTLGTIFPPTTFIGQASLDAGMLIANNASFSARNFADDASFTVGRLSTADLWIFGNSLADSSWRSLANANIQINAVDIANFTSDGLVLEDTMSLDIRNDADNDTLSLVARSNTSDVLIFGDANSGNSQYLANDSASAHRFFTGGVETFRVANLANGGAKVYRPDAVAEKVGYRHGPPISNPSTIIQDYEGRVLAMTGATARNWTLDQLEEGTVITISNQSSAEQIVTAGTASIAWLDPDLGGGGLPSINIASNSVATIWFRLTGSANIWGNGLST